MTVSRRLRFEILRRDNHTCRYCGAVPPAVKLTVDHVLAVALGGTDDPSNLVASCQACNAGKASTSPDAQLVADVKADVARWRWALAYCAARMADEDEALNDQIDQFAHAWDGWRCKRDGEDAAIPRDDDWRVSVRAWLTRGLPLSALIGHIEIAMTARPNGYPLPHYRCWRYYCGVMWKRLTILEESATQLAEWSRTRSSVGEP